jgi:hypothetical protein
MERRLPDIVMSCSDDTIGGNETPNAETIAAMREAESNVALDSFDLKTFSEGKELNPGFHLR